MAIKTTVVTYNSTTNKHEPLGVGDVLAGSVVQLSTNAGNGVTLGTDGGLLVQTMAALPDDQVLTGDTTGSVTVTLTPTVVGDQTDYLIKADTKIDPAAGNIATVSSAGVFVPTPVVPTFTASKQTEFGSQAANNKLLQTHVINFATDFPTVPFITLSSSIQEDMLIWKAIYVTTTGFLLEGRGNTTGSTGNVNWKAEEK